MHTNLPYKDIEHLPFPLLFNPMKHHVGFIIEWISEIASKPTLSVEDFEFLIRIGNSQTDLYWGKMDIEEIADEIATQLKERNIFRKEAYGAWLRESIWNFNRINLSDGSTWVFRPGVVENRYIHFHPGKYSLYTNRVRATNLKTAIAAKVASLYFQRPYMDVETVNMVRETWLDLPPLKSIGDGIGRVMQLIEG